MSLGLSKQQRELWAVISFRNNQKEHADPTGCLRPRSEFQTLYSMFKIGTKLRDAAPEIKEVLCVARKGPFICFWN